MELTRRKVLRIGGLAVAAIATGCATAPKKVATGATGTAGAAGAPLVVASSAITNSLDPAAALSNVGATFTAQVYDPLVTFGTDGKLAPALATAWHMVDDRTMEFALRQGVKFHRGGVFDAAAVKANIDRLLSGDPTFAFRAGQMGTLSGAEVVDASTVRITTKEPDPVLLNRLVRLSITDPAIFKEKPGTVASGTGPFRVTAYAPAKSIELEAFPESWRKSASVTTARIVAIPDPGTLTTALRTGEVDGAYGLPPAVAAQLAASFTVKPVTAGSCAVLSMIGDVEPKLRDKRVRLALNLAVNKEEFVKSGLSGYGEVPNGQLLQPGFVGHDPSLEAFPYDPDRAKALLKEAGAEGLTLNIATTALFKQQAEIAAGYLAKVGITSEVVIQDLSTFISTLLKKSETPLIYWQTDYFDLRDIAGVSRFGPQPEGVQKHVDDEEYVSLFTKAQAEMDPAKREETIKAMARRLHDEAGVVFLAWPQTVYVHSATSDLKLNVDGNVLLSESRKAI
ncbi:ABC transporter substrate-binding protein [Microtetraspora sp. AC03309]|uniref:ABC transporter substrate-binding protein n=1 Tax=Microtetraspora sp. AC03309 TaxID=2779376 RepID=UPI001E64C1AC|nr:ABC transporter substrate-binding protein [Microtetraspora sp. AC03309]MCC5578381.1 ABC transporter substrate-binding protein [Microtetraspora sp. AC03309]